MNFDALTQLFSWQFILFSLGVFVATWIVRTIVEYALPVATKGKFWQELCLPLTPPISGAIMAFFATKYAYPDGLTSLSGRLLFGSVAGMFSGFIYRVIKGLLKDKIQSFTNAQQDATTNQQNTQQQSVVPFPTNK